MFRCATASSSQPSGFTARGNSRIFICSPWRGRTPEGLRHRSERHTPDLHSFPTRRSSDLVSLRDGKLFTAERIHSSRQLTDLYLLALAGAHAGRLATFDQAISISAVCGAKVESLCVI